MAAPQLRVKFVKTLWAVTPLMGNTPNDGGYGRLFRRIAEEGFQAVECPVWQIEDKVAFAAALKEASLGWCAMINTCTPPGDNNGSHELEHHLASFERQLKEATSLDIKPLLINAHSGVDAFSPEKASAFFTRAIAVEAEYEGLLICHETHRGRILYNPWTTRDLCRAFPALKLTADLSHFCVVAERVFAADDADWRAVLKEVARATRHIHARVGYAEGPQVPDPRAPEYADALASHESWWDEILEAQAALGTASVTVEPEHGTNGYQQCLPYTGVETADLWAVNGWLRDRQAKRMAALPYWKA